MTSPLDAAVDIHRVRQYFVAAVRAREIVETAWRDVTFVDALRRALLPLPFDRRVAAGDPFGPGGAAGIDVPPGRLAVVTTGGSGATSALVGVVRALEEAGRRPDVYSLCSGSALFGFPLAAGMTAREVAELSLGFVPRDCVDVAWRRLAGASLRLGRGFTGLLYGDRVEAHYRKALGDRTLGELAVPAYAPIWNVEHNRLEYLGPGTHPDVPVATAIRMAVSMPLFFRPVPLAGGLWCDGGIVDILPVRPVLDIEPPCPTALVVNCFYPPGFAGEDATGWDREPVSILGAAAQVRTAQHLALARENLGRLRAAADVVLLEPVPYWKVRGAGFYRQFVDTSEWADFMRAGYSHTVGALRRRATRPPAARTSTSG